MKLRHIQTGAVGARTTRLRDGALPPWPPASPQFGPYSGRAPGRAGDVRRLRSRTAVAAPMPATVPARAATSAPKAPVPPRCSPTVRRPGPGNSSTSSTTEPAAWERRMSLTRRSFLILVGAGTAAGATAGGIFGASPSEAASPAGDVVGKITVGYQGWFACIGDGAPINGWWHWSQNWGQAPSPSNNAIKAWPDMREYTAGYQTA